MSASQPAYFHLQEFADLGAPLVGGRLYTYAQGTTALKVAYTDPAGAVPQTYTADGLGGQYIALNARGELPAPLYLASGSYDIALKRSDGSTVWSRRAEPTGDAAGALAASTGAGLLGWIQSGLGAIARTIQDKLRERISILDYLPTSEYAAILAGTSTYDCSAALSSAIASVRRGGLTYYIGGPRIYFPPGGYYFASRIELKSTVTLEGASGAPSGAFYPATELKFPAGSGGIVVHRYNTIGDGVEASPTTGADGTVIRNLQLTGVRAQAYSQLKPGIWVRARCLIENVTIDGFPGSGIMVLASSGGGTFYEGNANNWCINNVRVVQNSGSGLYVQGADANAGIATLADASSNGAYGIWDNSFLGNTYHACHSDANGVNGVGANGSATSIACYGGKTWYVVAGQSVAASTTAPGTNSAVWGKVSDSLMARPNWVSGGTYIDGGAYRTDGLNAANVFYGGYSEGGQSPAQMAPLTLVIGGLPGAGLVGASIGATLNAPFASPSITAIGKDSAGNSMKVIVGSNDINTKSALEIIETNLAPNSWRLKVRTDGGLTLDYSNSGFYNVFDILGPNNTIYNCGRSAGITSAFLTTKLWVGNGNAARHIDADSAAPTSGEYARGDVRINNAAAAAGKAGWICTTGGTAGSTAVFKQFGVIDA